MRDYVQRQTRAFLRTLAARLKLAAVAGSSDSIHDLRVAIRRASRGLRAFAPFYPDRSWKSIRKRLRHMMRLTGAVRDHDIAIECLAKAGVSEPADIVTHLRAERSQANIEFLAEIRRWKEQGITRLWRAQLSSVPARRQDRSTPQAYVRRVLPRLAGDYFGQVRKLLAASPQPKDLHRARLATKRFRYTLELFSSCYGTGLETRIAGLRKVQHLLGDVNDCVASWRLLFRAMDKSPQRKMVHEFLRLRARHHADAFRKEWEESFDAPGREAWWKSYLKNIRRST